MKVGIVGEGRNCLVIQHVIFVGEGKELNILCFYWVFKLIAEVVLLFSVAGLRCFFPQHLELYLWTKNCSPTSFQSFQATVSFGFPLALPYSSGSGGKHGSDHDSDYSWHMYKRVSYNGWRVDSAFNSALLQYNEISSKDCGIVWFSYFRMQLKNTEIATAEIAFPCWVLECVNESQKPNLSCDVKYILCYKVYLRLGCTFFSVCFGGFLGCVGFFWFFCCCCFIFLGMGKVGYWFWFCWGIFWQEGASWFVEVLWAFFLSFKSIEICKNFLLM